MVTLLSGQPILILQWPYILTTEVLSLWPPIFAEVRILQSSSIVDIVVSKERFGVLFMVGQEVLQLYVDFVAWVLKLILHSQ